MNRLVLWGALGALGAMACTDGDEGVDVDAGGGGDADTDADADSDTDADTDTDIEVVDLDGDGFGSDLDCDDGDDAVYPGAPDRCGDDRATDCDRDSDDGLVTIDGVATYTDLGAALAAAAAGATVLVCPGDHGGPYVLAHPVVLASHRGRDVTVISGQGAGTALTVPGGTVLRGLTVRDGDAERGGGIRVTDGEVTIEDCVVTDNVADQGGGLAVDLGAIVTVSGSSIEGNTGRELGGGVLVDEGATVDLTGSTVGGNRGGAGGGVMLLGGSLVGGEVTDNEALGDSAFEPWLGEVYGPYGGGGVSGFGDVAVSGTVIRANRGGDGHGVSLLAGIATLDGVDIVDNVPSSGAGTSTSAAGYGGGLYLHAATVTLTDTTVSGNQANQGGGAEVQFSTLVGGTFDGNEATGSFGGGLEVVHGDVAGAVVTANTAFYGGGMYVIGDCTLTGVTLDGNEALFGGGGLVTADDPDAYGPATVGVVVHGGAITANTARQAAGVKVTVPSVLDGVAITDNVATGSAGGLQVYDPVTITGGSVLRNEAAAGGGAELGYEGAIDAVEVDWGSGADDNTPDDVLAGASYAGYGLATFGCTVDGCSPTP